MTLMSMVQQGIVSDAQRGTLTGLLPDLVERHLRTPPTPDRVAWNEIPATYGYTAGKQSRSSVVQIDAPAATDQAVREALMNDVCNLWIDVTGCTINEIIVIVADHEPRSNPTT